MLVTLNEYFMLALRNPQVGPVLATVRKDEDGSYRDHAGNEVTDFPDAYKPYGQAYGKLAVTFKKHVDDGGILLIVRGADDQNKPSEEIGRIAETASDIAKSTGKAVMYALCGKTTTCVYK